jgi:hypothetical protein
MDDFFKDTVVDELESSDAGWLTLAIEPYTCDLIDRFLAADLEESYSVEYANLVEDAAAIASRYGDIKKASVTNSVFKHNNITDITVEELNELVDLKESNDFRFSDEVVIDFSRKQLTGTIELLIPEISEDDILKLVLSRVKNRLRDLGDDGFNITKCNEVMSVLECKEHLNSKSQRRKERSVAQRFIEIVKNDTWRIRDGDLIIKAAGWLVQACAGSTYGIANLTKLKCMTYSGKVIYSMEEIV